jgi:hypothetical protein
MRCQFQVSSRRDWVRWNLTRAVSLTCATSILPHVGCTASSEPLPAASIVSEETLRRLAASLVEAPDRAASSLRKILRIWLPAERRGVSDYLVRKLLQLDSQTDQYVAGRMLESVRAIGQISGACELPALVAALSPQSFLLSGRPKAEVSRLRAFTLLVVAEVGLAQQAVGVVVDHLSNGMKPVEIASGARAARQLAGRADVFVPLLRPYVLGVSHDTILSLDRYEQRDFPEEEATSIQLESIRTLAAFGSQSLGSREQLERLVERLKSIKVQQPLPILDEATRALSKIGNP